MLFALSALEKCKSSWKKVRAAWAALASCSLFSCHLSKHSFSTHNDQRDISSCLMFNVRPRSSSPSLLSLPWNVSAGQPEACHIIHTCFHAGTTESCFKWVHKVWKLPFIWYWCLPGIPPFTASLARNYWVSLILIWRLTSNLQLFPDTRFILN